MKKLIAAAIVLASFNASANSQVDAFADEIKSGVFTSTNGKVSTHKIEYSRKEFLPCAAYIIQKEKPQASFYEQMSEVNKGSVYFDIENQLIVGLTNSITLDLALTKNAEFKAECELIRAGVLK